MIRRVLILLAFATSGVIVASFALFGRDQIAGASAHQQALIAIGAHEDPAVDPITSDRGQPRAFIDGAAAKLIGPFRKLGGSGQWPRELVGTLIGLLIYGVGIGYLARFSSGRARSHRPHLAHHP